MLLDHLGNTQSTTTTTIRVNITPDLSMCLPNDISIKKHSPTLRPSYFIWVGSMESLGTASIFDHLCASLKIGFKPINAHQHARNPGYHAKKQYTTSRRSDHILSCSRCLQRADEDDLKAIHEVGVCVLISPGPSFRAILADRAHAGLKRKQRGHQFSVMLANSKTAWSLRAWQP